MGNFAENLNSGNRFRPPLRESNPRVNREHHPNEIMSTHVEKQLEIFSVTCLQNLLVFSNQV